MPQIVQWILFIGKSGSFESVPRDTVPEQRQWKYCSFSWNDLSQWRDWSMGCCMASMAEHWRREHHSAWWNNGCQRWTVHPFTAIPHCPNSDISSCLSAHKNEVCQFWAVIAFVYVVLWLEGCLVIILICSITTVSVVILPYIAWKDIIQCNCVIISIYISHLH